LRPSFSPRLEEGREGRVDLSDSKVLEEMITARLFVTRVSGGGALRVGAELRLSVMRL
jgi:hypothetical protein